MRIGEKVRKLREYNGYSQEYLSFRLGVSQSMISRIENDLIEYKYGTLERICEVFELSINDLVEKDLSSLIMNIERLNACNEIINKNDNNYYNKKISNLENKIAVLEQSILQIIAKS